VKKIIISALIITLLAGSGAAFGGNNPVIELAGINAGASNEPGAEENHENDETVQNDETARAAVYSNEESDVASTVHEALSGDEEVTPDDGREFGQEVAERARDADIHLGTKVSEAAREAVYSEDEYEEERSDVAKAVHKALSGDEEITPHDGREFGEAVSNRARDEEIDLGKEVSNAAREANNSIINSDTEKDEQDKQNDNDNTINSGNPGKAGNAGNSNSSGSPGNSGNAGNTGNSGNSGSPGNSGNAGNNGGSSNAGGGGRP